VLGIKYYVDRPRPYENHPELAKIFEKVDPSFPSAHTFLSFLVLYFIPKQLPKWTKYTFILYLTVLIPIGVLYAGVHYPSDVLFGAIIGLLFPKIVSENLAKKIFKF
jgi:undecaprenyl-diphosphatase